MIIVMIVSIVAIVKVISATVVIVLVWLVNKRTMMYKASDMKNNVFEYRLSNCIILLV